MTNSAEQPDLQKDQTVEFNEQEFISDFEQGAEELLKKHKVGAGVQSEQPLNQTEQVNIKETAGKTVKGILDRAKDVFKRSKPSIEAITKAAPAGEAPAPAVAAAEAGVAQIQQQVAEAQTESAQAQINIDQTVGDSGHESPVELGPAVWKVGGQEVPVEITEDLGVDSSSGKRQVKVSYKDADLDGSGNLVSGEGTASFDDIAYNYPVLPGQQASVVMPELIKAPIEKKTERSYDGHQTKEASGVVANVIYRTATTIFGVKTLTDLGLVLAKKGDIYEHFKGKKAVKVERVALQDSVENLFKQYNSGEASSSERFINAVKELDKKIGTSKKGEVGTDKYLNPDERKVLRSQLARTIWEYRKKEQALDGERNTKVARAAELYYQNKVSGYRLAGDALNTAFTFGGLPVLKGAGYGLMAMTERWHKSGIDFQRAELLRASKEVTIGTKATDQPVQLAEKKLGPKKRFLYSLKDIALSATWETARGMVYLGKKAGSEHRFRDFAEAWGSAVRFFGLTGGALSELSSHGVTESIDKALDNISANGFGQLGSNFMANAERMIQMYSHPLDTASQSWEGVKAQTGRMSDFLHGRSPAAATIEQPVVAKDDASKVPAADKNNIPPADSSKSDSQQPSVGDKSGASTGVESLKGPAWSEANVTVDKGGSYWSTFLKQYHADPKAFGFEGDLGSAKAVNAYGNRIMAEYAAQGHGDQGALVRTNADKSVTDIHIKNPGAKIWWHFNKQTGALEMTQEQVGQPKGKIQTYEHTSPDGHHEVKSSGEGIAHEQSTTRSLGVNSNEVFAKGGGKAGDYGLHPIEAGKPAQFAGILPQDKIPGAKVWHNADVAMIAYDDDGNGTIDRVGFHDFSKESGAIFDQYIVSGKHSVTDNAATIAAAHKQFVTLDNNIATARAALPELARGLSPSQQIELMRLAGLDPAKDIAGQNLAGSGFKHLGEVVGSDTRLLADSEFRGFLKNHHQELVPGKAQALYNDGQFYRQAGFKSIDYSYLSKFGSGDRQWSSTTDTHTGTTVFKSGKVVSPFTGQALGFEVKPGSSFNQQTFDEGWQQINQRSSLQQQEFLKMGSKTGISAEDLAKVCKLQAFDLTSGKVVGILGSRIGLSDGGANNLWNNYLQGVAGKNGTVGEVLAARVGVSQSPIATELPKSEVERPTSTEAPKRQPGEGRYTVDEGNNYSQHEIEPGGKTVRVVEPGPETVVGEDHPSNTGKVVGSSPVVEQQVEPTVKQSAIEPSVDQGKSLKSDGEAKIPPAEVVTKQPNNNEGQLSESLVEQSTSAKSELEMNGKHIKGRVELEFEKKDGKIAFINAKHEVTMMGVGEAELIQEKVFVNNSYNTASDYVHKNIDNPGAYANAMNGLTQRGRELYMHLQTHEALIKNNQTAEAAEYAKLIQKDLARLEKTYGPDVFDHKSIEAQLNPGSKTEASPSTDVGVKTESSGGAKAPLEATTPVGVEQSQGDIELKTETTLRFSGASGGMVEGFEAGKTHFIVEDSKLGKVEFRLREGSADTYDINIVKDGVKPGEPGSSLSQGGKPDGWMRLDKDGRVIETGKM